MDLLTAFGFLACLQGVPGLQEKRLETFLYSRNCLMDGLQSGCQMMVRYGSHLTGISSQEIMMVVQLATLYILNLLIDILQN